MSADEIDKYLEKFGLLNKGSEQIDTNEYMLKSYSFDYINVYKQDDGKNAILIKEVDGFGFLKCNCIIWKFKNGNKELDCCFPCPHIIEYLRGLYFHCSSSIYISPSDFSLCLYQDFIQVDYKKEIQKVRVAILNFEEFLNS